MAGNWVNHATDHTHDRIVDYETVLTPAAAVTVQPAIADVTRDGLITEQTQHLQNKVDEILAALRSAGVIAT